jgi:enoyl-CoA hydratase
MTFEFLKVEQKNAVAVVTLNRPEALNALNTSVLGELLECMDTLNSAPETRAVILTGSGKAFVAGADIQAMSEMMPDAAQIFSELGMRVMRRIETLDKPVIAAINGFAIGGGCELAMACDIRLAGRSAKMGQPEVGLGITPGFGGTQRLSRLVGTSMAMEMILTGGLIKAEEAYRIGLVNHVYEDEALLENALVMAEKMAANAWVAVKYSKKAIRQGLDLPEEQGCAYESAVFGLTFSTEDQKGAMKAFIEKSKYAFTHS